MKKKLLPLWFLRLFNTSLKIKQKLGIVIQWASWSLLNTTSNIYHRGSKEAQVLQLNSKNKMNFMNTGPYK